MKAEEHEPCEMERKKPFVQFTQYVNKGHKAAFECPVCHRVTWQHLNFLGQRILICDGLRLRKQHKGVTK